LLCSVTALAGVAAEADADAWLREVLARALEANERWERTAAGLGAENARLREENARLRERDAQREAELERVSADLAVLQRLVFGRSSERGRPEAAAGGDENQGRGRAGGGGRRGPGARAGRRDYSHLPRVEVVWDFPGGGYCCTECGEPFTLLGDHVIEQLDWQVTVRVAAHCRRRYRRACSCRVPATVMASGPPKAISKGLLSNGFIAMLLTERYVAGRSQNSLVTGLARTWNDSCPGTQHPKTCAPGHSHPRTDNRKQRQRRYRENGHAACWHARSHEFRILTMIAVLLARIDLSRLSNSERSRACLY
jgi:transposase